MSKTCSVRQWSWNKTFHFTGTSACGGTWLWLVSQIMIQGPSASESPGRGRYLLKISTPGPPSTSNSVWGLG